MSLTIHERIALDITEDGCGLIRCETCGDNYQPGTSTIANYLAHGWPKCCGHTMHWWTKHQLDAGEMPAWTGAANEKRKRREGKR